MSNYSEMFKDPRWQRRRLKILDRDKWKCQCCGKEDKELHVHHKWYEKGKDPWDYPYSCFVTLCSECHENEDLIEKEYKELFLSSVLGRGLLFDDLLDMSFAIGQMSREQVMGIFNISERSFRNKQTTVGIAHE